MALPKIRLTNLPENAEAEALKKSILMASIPRITPSPLSSILESVPEEQAETAITELVQEGVLEIVEQP